MPFRDRASRTEPHWSTRDTCSSNQADYSCRTVAQIADTRMLLRLTFGPRCKRWPRLASRVRSAYRRPVEKRLPTISLHNDRNPAYEPEARQDGPVYLANTHPAL